MSLTENKKFHLLLAFAVVVVDQWSKWLVEKSLPMFSSVEVIPGLLDLTHVQNTGVAFGLFAAKGSQLGTWILTLLGLTALAVIGVYFRRTPPHEGALLASLGLILGGAVGNLLDRVFAGAVTDFIDFYWRSYHFHTFNVADSAITIGIGIMLLDAIRRRDPQPA